LSSPNYERRQALHPIFPLPPLPLTPNCFEKYFFFFFPFLSALKHAYCPRLHFVATWAWMATFSCGRVSLLQLISIDLSPFSQGFFQPQWAGPPFAFFLLFFFKPLFLWRHRSPTSLHRRRALFPFPASLEKGASYFRRRPLKRSCLRRPLRYLAHVIVKASFFCVFQRHYDGPPSFPPLWRSHISCAT